MNSSWYPELEEHIPAINLSFEGVFGFDREKLYDRLILLYDEYTYINELVSGRGDDGLTYPSIKMTTAYLKRTRIQISKQIAWIDENFLYVWPPTSVEPCDSKREHIPRSPPHLRKLRQALIEAHAVAEATEPSVTGRIKPGRNPDVIQRLVDQLQSLYEEFAETKATALSVGLDGHPPPTEFQRFARNCFVAFGIQLPDSFEEAIHKKLDRSKSKFLK